MKRRIDTSSDACSEKFGNKNIKVHIITVRQTFNSITTNNDLFLVSLGDNFKIYKLLAYRIKYFKLLQSTSILSGNGAVYFLNSDTLSKMTHNNNTFITGNAADNNINQAAVTTSIIAQTVNVGNDNAASFMVENQNPMFTIQDSSTSTLSLFDLYITSLSPFTLSNPHSLEVSIELYYLDENY